MKIYHKRSFAGGILCLLLAVGCGALLAAEGFQVKLLVSLALLLFLGGVDLVWAMSRESRMPRGDERDRQISEKSAWSAYLVLTNGRSHYCYELVEGEYRQCDRFPSIGSGMGD